MRIAAKRLRYVLEVTGFCFGGRPTRRARSARELQDMLGEIHDCDVMLPRVSATISSACAPTTRAAVLHARATRRSRPGARRRARRNRTAYRGLERAGGPPRAPAAHCSSSAFADFWQAEEPRHLGGARAGCATDARGPERRPREARMAARSKPGANGSRRAARDRCGTLRAGHGRYPRRQPLPAGSASAPDLHRSRSGRRRPDCRRLGAAWRWMVPQLQNDRRFEEHDPTAHERDAARAPEPACGRRRARPRGPLALLQPRALLARLQRPGAAARRGPVASRCWSGSSFCAIYEDNLDEFFMVRVAGLARPGRGRRSTPAAPTGCARRAVIDAIRRARRSTCASGSRRCFDGRAAPGARRARASAIISLDSAQRGGARGARAPVQEPGLPGADAAGDRPRAAVPLHLEPLAQPRRPAAQPREGRRGHRPGQGAEGAAAPLPLDRRRDAPSSRSRR